MPEGGQELIADAQEAAVSIRPTGKVGRRHHVNFVGARVQGVDAVLKAVENANVSAVGDTGGEKLVVSLLDGDFTVFAGVPVVGHTVAGGEAGHVQASVRSFDDVREVGVFRCRVMRRDVFVGLGDRVETGELPRAVHTEPDLIVGQESDLPGPAAVRLGE